MNAIPEALANHPFFAGLPAPVIERAADCRQERSFDAGAFLLREGAEAATFFLLRTGRVALEVQVPGRGAERIETLGPGDVLGLSWLVPPYRWHLDARALEPTAAFVLDASCLRRQMEEDPVLGAAVAQRLFAQTWKRLQRVRLQRLDLYRGEI
ncbi:cyclic nucleotide-binding domain-containing protein [Vulgatibacter sp.]|uniref:cyclic nucleotide-binding domain-containing protein n=1 Tax=Vulgatibacter sp. TaxID=1971226 RepID=UPI003565EB7D